VYKVIITDLYIHSQKGQLQYQLTNDL